MKLILIGAPASGKGTQAELLCSKFNLPHISTGDIFRKEVSDKTPLGLKIQQLMANGNLIPDDITLEVVKERLKQKDTLNGFLLDGFPRTLNQAQKLSEFCDIDKAIFIKVSLESIIKRIENRKICSKCKKIFSGVDFNKCDSCDGELVKRLDDTVEKATSRFNDFTNLTMPTVPYYKNAGKLIEVDGEQTIENVFSEIIKNL